mmetsp:Transcript_22035/g.30976  ORF Transcript_22035/g.30976 Transcript_22035/m.30976 type:complete len:225 (-) Transcript_22035:747-1421(-)
MSYIDLGSGKKLHTAPFSCEEGVQQGTVESMQLFNLGIDEALKTSHQKLKDAGGAIITGADDAYIIGPPQLAFDVLNSHKDELKKLGLELSQKVEKIKDSIVTTTDRINPAHVHALEIPSSQSLWCMIFRCLQYLGNYWVRHLSPIHTGHFSKVLDETIQQSLQIAIDIDTQSLLMFKMIIGYCLKEDYPTLTLPNILDKIPLNALQPMIHGQYYYHMQTRIAQ